MATEPLIELGTIGEIDVDSSDNVVVRNTDTSTTLTLSNVVEEVRTDEEIEDVVGALLEGEAEITLNYADANNPASLTIGIADNSLAEAKLAFDTATQTELDTHAADADAHHAKTSSGDIDHDSTVGGTDSDAHHTKTTTAAELTDVSADSVTDAHHTKTPEYTDSDAIDAINTDADHGSTASHNYFGGAHDDLSDDVTGAGDQDNSGTVAIQDVTVDPHGHVTALSAADVSGLGALSDAGTDNADGGDQYVLPAAADSIDLQGSGAVEDAEDVGTDNLVVRQGHGLLNLPSHHINYGSNLSDEEVARYTLGAGEVLEVWRLDCQLKGGGSDNNVSVDIYDVDAAATLASTTAGSLTQGGSSPLGTSNAGSTITVRITTGGSAVDVCTTGITIVRAN